MHAFSFHSTKSYTERQTLKTCVQTNNWIVQLNHCFLQYTQYLTDIITHISTVTLHLSQGSCNILISLLSIDKGMKPANLWEFDVGWFFSTRFLHFWFRGVLVLCFYRNIMGLTQSCRLTLVTNTVYLPWIFDTD